MVISGNSPQKYSYKIHCLLSSIAYKAYRALLDEFTRQGHSSQIGLSLYHLNWETRFLTFHISISYLSALGYCWLGEPIISVHQLYCQSRLEYIFPNNQQKSNLKKDFHFLQAYKLIPFNMAKFYNITASSAMWMPSGEYLKICGCSQI